LREDVLKGALTKGCRGLRREKREGGRTGGERRVVEELKYVVEL
jgi:hypothetical protein